MSGTLTIPQAAKLLGIGRNLAYETAARDGSIAGVPVLRVGRRLLVPRRPLLRLLGLEGHADDVRPRYVPDDRGTVAGGAR